MAPLSEIQQRELLNRIQEESKEYSYAVREWDIGTVYEKFQARWEEEDGEIFIPTYQRNFTWDTKRQSRFIESLFMNLPIPFIFLNQSFDVNQSLEDASVLEIIDGSQRIRTLTHFIDNNLKLNGLESIPALNGVKFLDLPVALQKRFKLSSFRAIIFNNLPAEKRKEMFNRINTSADQLKWMEVRKWTYEWPVYNTISTLSKSKLFEELAPLSAEKKNRDEWSELVLRYFAYTEEYTKYNSNVQDFLDTYMRNTGDSFDKMTSSARDKRIDAMQKDFTQMLKFVKEYFPNGFRKDKKSKHKISRAFFEAIAVGTGLAIKKVWVEKLHTQDISKLLDSDKFKTIVTSDSANNLSKFRSRIEIVRDYLLTWKISWQ